MSASANAFRLTTIMTIAVAWMGSALGQSSTGNAGWRLHASREEIAPRFWSELRNEGPLLGLAGRGDDSVDGRWEKTVAVMGGTYYGFEAEYQARDVPTPRRSVLARVLWFDAQGKQLEQAEYPVTGAVRPDDGWTPVVGTYRAPEMATKARLELHLRWAARGHVLWRGAELKETTPPASRVVRLAAIHHRPRSKATTESNLTRFLELVGDAAAQKADIVCLPEGITVVGTGNSYTDVAEPIPGPSTKRLGEAAQKHGLYLAAGLYERDGKAVFNTSVLLGRDGELLGKYRKVCLPREEIDGGITPGSEYPVFDTDFGRVGMMICWDVSYPEVARELAARGAEVILMPIWGGEETLARARAIENQIYLVASGYDFRTAIYDRTGKRVAMSDRDPSVILFEVDLNRRTLWPWLGDWRARVWREGPARPTAQSSSP